MIQFVTELVWVLLKGITCVDQNIVLSPEEVASPSKSAPLPLDVGNLTSSRIKFHIYIIEN